MPASYVHQSVAAHAADALSLFTSDAERSALLAGAEGPDPMFFCFRPGKPFAPVVASLLHTQKTDDFLLALCDACAGDALLRAYCCGFFTHYATDTTFHPFVYAHSLTAAGKYSGNAHCTLEHQLETLHYRREGHATGLPVQMGGFAALDAAQRKKIAAALSAALARVFPDSVLSPARLEKCFSDAVGLCRFLRSEDGRRYRTLGGMLSPFKLDEALHAHMMPAEPPQADIANDAHAPWASIWTPDEVRHDSFGDLFAASVARAEALASAANALMLVGYDILIRNCHQQEDEMRGDIPFLVCCQNPLQHKVRQEQCANPQLYFHVHRLLVERDAFERIDGDADYQKQRKQQDDDMQDAVYSFFSQNEFR